MDWLLLIASLVLILVGAQLFTNGVEWVGEGFGLSEGAVGSVLAAIGTALPETILPIIAIAGGSASSGTEIGTGAILGAPFMLSTLAMAVIGLALAWYSRDERRSAALQIDAGVARIDLVFFLVMYSAALLAGLWHPFALRVALAAALLIAYGFYVRMHLSSPGEKRVESEAAGEIRPLYMKAWVDRARRRHGYQAEPRLWNSIAQTLVALGVVIVGAREFVDGMHMIAERFNLSPLVFALLVAPVATELPEVFNSVLWVGRRKDTLAFGNVSGAMVFQSSFPVSVGLLFTPWHLSQEGLVSGVIALLAGGSVYIAVRVHGTLGARMLLSEALLFVAYVAYVVVTRT